MLAFGGVALIGADERTATKLLYTAILVVGLLAVRWAARQLVRLVARGRARHTTRFWARQAINLATAVVVVVGLVSIWFDNGLHAATALGLISAGLAFALQKAVTSVAGYFLILRGDIFSIGDRIVMGGVRGDVIGLGFLRTTILEMGQPDDDSEGAMSVWVDARQYTGRVVTVTNGVVFDDPVFNYSRDFPFLWEELSVGVKYDADWHLAERLLFEAVEAHALDGKTVGAEAMRRMQRRFYVPSTDLEPEVYVKMSESWISLTARFIVPVHGIRRIKSDITRDVLDSFAENGVHIAFPSYAISEVPPLRVASETSSSSG